MREIFGLPHLVLLNIYPRTQRDQRVLAVVCIQAADCINGGIAFIYHCFDCGVFDEVFGRKEEKGGE